MAEIFENYLELMPEWANKSLEEDVVEAVKEYEGYQQNRNTKSHFVKLTKRKANLRINE